MYAIVETGGKQYRVKPGDTVAVEKISGEPGDVLDLGRVLLVADNGEAEPRIGSPEVAGAVVRAEVLAHFRGEKIIIFRYKSKVRYRRKTGHRQSLTRLRITDILFDGVSSASAVDEGYIPPIGEGATSGASEPVDVEPPSITDVEAAAVEHAEASAPHPHEHAEASAPHPHTTESQPSVD